MQPFRSEQFVGSWKVTFALLPLGIWFMRAFRDPLFVMKINRRRALKSTAAGVGALSMLPSDGLAAEAARPFGEDFPNLESPGAWGHGGPDRPIRRLLLKTAEGRRRPTCMFPEIRWCSHCILHHKGPQVDCSALSTASGVKPEKHGWN